MIDASLLTLREAHFEESLRAPFRERLQRATDSFCFKRIQHATCLYHTEMTVHDAPTNIPPSAAHCCRVRHNKVTDASSHTQCHTQNGEATERCWSKTKKNRKWLYKMRTWTPCARGAQVVRCCSSHPLEYVMRQCRRCRILGRSRGEARLSQKRHLLPV